MLLALAAGGCGAEVETAPPPGELMLAVQTDMSLPKDVDKIRIEVLSFGSLQFGNDYDVGPAGLKIPATIGIVQGEDPSAPVTIRVVARQGEKARMLREVVTTVPDRLALLRVPIQWLCDGSAEETSPGQVVEGRCPAQQTCVAGGCTSWEVDAGELVDFAAADVFGGGTGTGDGSCFDTVACLGQGATVVPDAACTIAAPADLGKANVGLSMPADGDGICDEAATTCIVPLDRASDAGWSEGAEGRLRLPAAVCERIAEGRILGVIVSESCANKTASIPTCGPWSSVSGSGDAPACNPGSGDCDGDVSNGCETLLDTSANCGVCGRACEGGSACVAGECRSGACAIDADCPSGQSCVAGACTSSKCDPGKTGDCDAEPANGCETNLLTSSANCGACGAACAAGKSCASGVCTSSGLQCAPGTADCDGGAANGCETSLTSEANCGACGVACTTGQLCVNGSCAGSACSPGWVDCAGVCYCGICGQICEPPQTCVAGACTAGSCEAGFADCDANAANGCEASLGSDVQNCGACGSACSGANGVASCSSGACAVVCNPGFSDCDGIASNGCETDLSGGSTCSCTGGGAGAGLDCGPLSSASCCDSKLVTGGTFNRSYDGVTFTDASNTATVSSFRLDTYEITVGRFRKFVDSGRGTQANPPAAGDGAHPLIPGSGWDAAWNGALAPDTASLTAALTCNPGYSTWTDAAVGNEKLPMSCITWFDAFAFCAWDGGRLPTEAEWNYAAAGGSEHRVYPWSSPPSSTVIDGSYAAYGCLGDGVAGCTLADVLAVGSMSPKGDGKYGQADLAGNMEEWVLDYYASPYTINPCNDCANLTIAPFYVRRGGGSEATSSSVRAAYRYYAASNRYQNTGARCARSP